MKITFVRLSVLGLMAFVMLVSASAQAEESKASTAKFFATLTPSDLSKGMVDPTPQQIEAAQKAKESRPAADDSEGHWGEPLEGIQLSVRFEKSSYHVGEPVIAMVLIRNATNRNVYYRDFIGSKEDSPVCQFDVLDEQQKPMARLIPRAPDDVTDGPHIPRGLKPGSQCHYDVKLETRFNLSQPGKYTIRARRWVHKLQGDGYVQIKSALATITLSKAGDSPATGVKAKP